MSWGRDSGNQQLRDNDNNSRNNNTNSLSNNNHLDTEPSSANRPPASRGGGPGPIKSANGWIIFVTGIHPPATDGVHAGDEEENWIDAFSEFGQVCKFTMNRDRQTGACQGYALVEFAEYTEAQDAINALHGKEILGNVVGVDWAFVHPTTASRGRRTNRHRR